MEQRKTCEESRLILTDDGQEKRERLAKAIAEIVESDPEERFVLIDPKRVELEEAEAKLLVLGKRIKEASEVAPLLQKTLDEIRQRRKEGHEGMRICLAIAEYGDVHEQRPECDSLILEMLKEDYEGVRLILATQRAREMKELIEELKGEGNHE
jgi:formyltetrahydrofolate synthetase